MPQMQLPFLLFVTVGALVVFIARSLNIALQRRRQARKHGCQPIVQHPSNGVVGKTYDDEQKQAWADGELNEWARRQYGRVGSQTYEVRTLHERMIITSEPENYRVITTGLDEWVREERRPGQPFFGVSILNSNGAAWRRIRDLITPMFKRAELDENIRDFKIFVDRMIALVPRDGTTIDMQPLMRKLFLDSSTEFIFGQSVDTLRDSTTRSQDFIAAFNRATAGAGKRLRPTSRLAKLTANIMPDRAWRADCKIVHDYVDDCISQHRASVQSSEKRGQRYVLIESMSQAVPDPIELRFQLVQIFSLARETAAMGFSSVLFMLARNPHYWTELRAQALSLGEDHPLILERLKELPLFRHTVLETFRLHSPVTRNRRQAACDTVLPLGGGPDGTQPLFVLKDTVIWVDKYRVLRDPKVWGDDIETFRPSRWENRRSSWDFTPFGMGPRMCPASQLVVSQCIYLLFRLVREFEAIENRDSCLEYVEAALMCFENVVPLKLQWLLHFSIFNERISKLLQDRRTIGVDPSKLFEKALKDRNDVKITGVIPRPKDGGAFIRFSHPADVTAESVEQRLYRYLEEKDTRPWWNPFRHTRARLVRGRPWVEDLFRPPCSCLKVEFAPAGGPETPVVSEEQLYGIFRPYGKLLEITPQPADSKDLPKYSIIHFSREKADAIMARNCLHGAVIPDESLGADSSLARLKISYEWGKSKSGAFREWLMSHPRIVLPILIALGGIITVSIFDPIRTSFIKLHITGTPNFLDNKVYAWFASNATRLLTFTRRHSNEDAMGAIWEDRKQNIEQIQKWLLESTDTFIVVQGPRGSGKRELVVDQALKHVKYKLVIDCKAVQEARGDTATIDAIAKAVGYKPVFSWVNSFSGLLDLAAQGATGMKTGFSQTLDTQLDNILNNTATALRQVTLDQRSKDDKDASIPDDAYLEAHPEKRPTVIIDNFLHKSQDSTVIYDKLADWAAGVTSGNAGHVIFLTTDVSFSKSLGRALPDRVLRQISLGDSPPEVSKRFVINHLDAYSDDLDNDGQPTDVSPSQTRKDLGELDECISSLGGRLTDLEFLARRIKSGESPKEAVREIVDQTVSEVLKIFILGPDQETSSASSPGSEKRAWTSQQAWVLIRELANAPEGILRYNEMLLNPAYQASNVDNVLQSLEQAELITIVSSNGRPHSIKPGKPVYLPAFKLLTGDKVLQSRLDVALLTEQMKSETSSIEKNEMELRLLDQLGSRPYELRSRYRWLVGKLAASQAKVEDCERKIAGLKRVMSGDAGA
ncbi:MAG: mitochondrial escape protein 2 [Chrysothrix sp. TS-e1954]|nr:MAG: mitochondrial escape protein 2 [Chrysothrix sp. TS-e1954]